MQCDPQSPLWLYLDQNYLRFPERVSRDSDRADFEALAVALPRCPLITCDAFMADVVRRASLDRRFGCELYSGRRRDVLALRDRLAALAVIPPPGTSPEPG